MNGDSSLPIALDACGGGRPYLAYPTKETPRWVVPLDRKLRRSSFAFYQPQRLRGRFLKLLLERGPVFGERVVVRNLSELEQGFAAKLGTDVRLAFSVGGPGAGQKVTAQVMSREGEVLAYAKIASRPSAIERLENEAASLVHLGTVPHLVNRVPQVLHWERRRGVASLLISAGPSKAGPKRFGRAHSRFLADLQSGESESVAFRDSNMAHHVTRTFEEVADALTVPWASRLTRSLDALQESLALVTMSVGLAHRDFTPWNTKMTADGDLFVFDWEFATDRYPHWYDRFHHVFMSHVLTRGAVPLGAVRDWVSDASLEGNGPRFFLAYVVEIALTYQVMLLARGGTSEDVVLRQTASLLDSREAWLR